MKVARFYTFLEEAYRLEAEREETVAIIACLPHMKENDRKLFFRELSLSKGGIINIGNNNDYSGLEKLKKELG
jgi:hypothetical protein